jgi:uncharacterized membrane protein YphA (DoxX/SURF4 family)
MKEHTGMSPESHLRQAFTAFHWVLGLALLWASVHTVVHADPGDLHAKVIGSLEALGAVAFLVPRTLRLGAGLLLVAILGAAVIHAARGEWRPDLLVYAAGVVLVLSHSDAAGRPMQA